MTGILQRIAKRLQEFNVPYEYGEWTGELVYPYFVGSMNEGSFRFEDNYTDGTFTINGWNTSSKLELIQMVDAIKVAFADWICAVDNCLYYVRFGNAQYIPSGEEGIYRVSITLNTGEWRGE